MRHSGNDPQPTAGQPEPSDWSRYGVTGDLSDEPSPPPVDESLLIRFLTGQTAEHESAVVRDRLRRFSAWRAAMEHEEAYERAAFAQRNAPWDQRDFATFVADYRRDLLRALTGVADSLLDNLLRGMTPEDRPGGPPVDDAFLRRVLSRSCTSPLEEIVAAGKYILTYRAWHERFTQLRAEAG